MGEQEKPHGIEQDFEAPKATVESANEDMTSPESPLSDEIREAMQAEYQEMSSERYKVLSEVQDKLAELMSVDTGDDQLEGADFKGVEQVRQILKDNEGDSAATQKALMEMPVSMLLRLGIMKKVKEFAKSSQVTQLVTLDKKLAQLRTDMGK